MDFWWEQGRGEAEQLRDIFDNATYGITDQELRDFGLSWDDLRTAYDIGFVADNVDPDEREQARDEFFDYIAELGYDADDFDWDAWRDWYEETH